MKTALWTLSLLGFTGADVYMHYPRGSNNRLNEASANRQNANRMFDSQNNNRGGYNKGCYTTAAFGQNSEADGVKDNEYTEGQYSEVVYEESELFVEYTNQHGCGGNEKDDTNKLNCNLVIQYMCNTDGNSVPFGNEVQMRDGRNTGAPNAPNGFTNVEATKQANRAAGRGSQESETWYYKCQTRQRNKQLYTADQKLAGETAKYTRQNPNGGKSGLECPEERDYYPYWHPTPWVDVAYLTDTPSDCDSEGKTIESLEVVKNSNNNNDKGQCVPATADLANNAAVAKAVKAITQEECESDDVGGVWETSKHDVPAPECKLGEWSRVNHLGNGRDGKPTNYKWTVPKVKELGQFTDTDDGVAKCVLRLRYNMSTDDFDPRTTNIEQSEDKQKGKKAIVENNPTVNVQALNLQGLRLAINTAQFGRTFQDRSHTFYIKERDALPNGKIHNLNVRGKRGNIVQTYPAVEYDFSPNVLEVKAGDLVHVQWTGSNTHNNGNPAGDGQAGDAGEGTGGTDRQNLVAIPDRHANYPISQKHALGPKYANAKALFKDDSFECWIPKPKLNTDTTYALNDIMIQLDADDCAVYLMSSGYFDDYDDALNGDKNLNPTLNNAPPSLIGGVFLKAKKQGEYHYMNTRNNNFSNRSQKGSVIVKN